MSHSFYAVKIHLYSYYAYLPIKCHITSNYTNPPTTSGAQRRTILTLLLENDAIFFLQTPHYNMKWSHRLNYYSFFFLLSYFQNSNALSLLYIEVRNQYRNRKHQKNRFLCYVCIYSISGNLFISRFINAKTSFILSPTLE